MNKKPTRTKSRKPSETESVTYSIEILDWELPYFLSINKTKDIIDGPLWEHLDLRLVGKFVHPEKLASNTIEGTIIGDRRKVSVVATPENYSQFEPNSIATLTVRGKQRELLGSMPFDVLSNISFLLHAGKIKFLVLNGQPLYRGSAAIRSMRFQKDFTEEDLL